MGLLANGNRDTIGVFRHYGGAAANGGYPAFTVWNYKRTGMMRNLTAGQGITDETVGLPYGYRHPGAWMLPQKAGALSSHNAVLGAGSFAGAGAMGVNAEASLAGAGDIQPVSAQLVVSLVASLVGSGTITNAQAVAYLQLAASLAGAGDLTGATGALASALAVLTGSGTATATPRGDGTLAAEITSAGGVLDTSNVGTAVWSALAASNNNVGTMGEKLNDAGSGSNPWTEVIESGYTAAEILRVLAAYAAGAVTGGPASPTFKSLDGSKTRIGGTADADGNRTRTTLDGS